jgi:hypothetical protein
MRVGVSDRPGSWKSRKLVVWLMMIVRPRKDQWSVDDMLELANQSAFASSSELLMYGGAMLP